MEKLENIPLNNGDQSQKPSTSAPTGTGLDDHSKEVIRLSIIAIADTCMGIPYAIGKNQDDYDAGVGQWRDLSKLPANLDCKGLVAGSFIKAGLKMPPFPGVDKKGSQQQFDFTIATTSPQRGDLAFLAHDKNINDVYHVGIVHDDENMIEARDFQKGASFETGKVIKRGRKFWEASPSFVGYRVHPKLV